MIHSAVQATLSVVLVILSVAVQNPQSLQQSLMTVAVAALIVLVTANVMMIARTVVPIVTAHMIVVATRIVLVKANATMIAQIDEIPKTSGSNKINRKALIEIDRAAKV